MTAPLVVSLGDPAGIGPELICAAWSDRLASGLEPFAIAGGGSLLAAAAAMRGIALPLVRIARLAEAAEVFPEALPVLGEDDAAYQPGKPSEDGARLALASLRMATREAVSGAARAIVTGPVAKAELARVGFDFPGQTEFLANACKVPLNEAVMLLAGPSLKTIPLTVHCPLAEVPALVTEDLILRRCRIAADGLRRDFGIAAPRLALAGLNPHAGEDGRMGREEIEIIAPAIARLRSEGIDATGPHPADSLFAPHERGGYDVAIAMYHDQALAPLKALDFDSGVNMTLGLPIVRTSPDHGTAFAIAGTGRANPGAMIAALRMASAAADNRARAT